MRNSSFFQLLFRPTYFFFAREKWSQRERRKNGNKVEGEENCEHVSPHITFIHCYYFKFTLLTAFLSFKSACIIVIFEFAFDLNLFPFHFACSRKSASTKAQIHLVSSTNDMQSKVQHRASVVSFRRKQKEN